MRIGEIFRYPKDKLRHPKEIDGYPNFSFYTNLPNENLVLLESGINPIGKVKVKKEERTPAIITSSSPHKIGSSDTPWQDIYNVEKGHIRYFGDNKDFKDPVTKKGNKALLNQFEIHNSSDSTIRKNACPIIFFKRKKINDKQKGYVEFNGFGVITNAERIVQHDKRNNLDFVNYRFDFVVLDMREENEDFNWEWVNARRDKSLSLEDTLKKAPSSWLKWIQKGNKKIDSLRRNVLKINILSTDRQKPEEGSKEFKTLKEIYNFYSDKKRFEYLASIVTEHLVKKSAKYYKKGWITKGSGDTGIDFIGRMDIGTDFGSAKLIVLGQAKCEKIDKVTGGTHIARLVAKLKRGWLGVYVTTSYFSKNIQEEILEDKYPLLLINGKKLAEVVNEIAHVEGYKNIREFLNKIDSEYEGAIKYRDPEEILSE